jgi:hypothetical protein
MFWVTGWAEHVARMAEKRETCKLLAIRPEPQRLMKKLISVMIILKRIFRRWLGEIELGYSGS